MWVSAEWPSMDIWSKNIGAAAKRSAAAATRVALVAMDVGIFSSVARSMISNHPLYMVGSPPHR